MIPELGIFIIVLLGVVFTGYVIACAMGGRYEPILLIWALLAPLGYAVLAYPHERSIITLHRAVILPLLALIPFFRSSPLGKVNSRLAWLATWWGLFVVGAMFSIINVPKEQLLYAAKTAIDAFVLPPLLAFVIYRTFRVSRHLSWLHIVISLVSIYLALIGGIEIFTGRALMPQAGAGNVLYAGLGLFQMVRPTGPYANPATFSLVGMMNLFLLLFFRRTMTNPTVPNRFLHWPGIVTSTAVALMTVTRGILVAFFIIFLVEVWRAKGIKQRMVRIIYVCGLLAFIGFSALYAPPEILEERADSLNFRGRVAQQAQTVRVFLDNPLTGVGLTSFITAAGMTARYDIAFQGSAPVGAPHNFLGEIVADTGVVGAVPFIISQILLIGVFRRLRFSNPTAGKFVWSYFCMIAIAYWVLNMDFGLGFYSELNLWFLFALSVLYKYALEQSPKQIATGKANYIQRRQTIGSNSTRGAVI